MKVLLIKDVKGLGKAGEVKEVKDGYGMNFLVGKGYAKVASTAVMRQHAAELARKEENDRYNHELMLQLKASLDAKVIKIKKQAGESGALFGGVTKDEVAKAISEQLKLEIDKKSIQDFVAKTAGEYDLVAKLGGGVNAEFKLLIEAK